MPGFYAMLENSLDVFKSDDEQAETIRKWWNENGKSIVTGIILGLVAIFGWRAWRDYERQQAEAASGLYQNVLNSVDRATAREEIRVISDKIIEDYGTTAYAVLVKLIDAKLAEDAKEYEAAAGHLRWALDHNKQSGVEHLIRLRLSRVLALQQKYDEARAQLKVSDQGEFAASYAETEADILKLQGDMNGARTLYQQALTKRQSAKLDTSLLELKLDDIGRSAE